MHVKPVVTARMILNSDHIVYMTMMAVEGLQCLFHIGGNMLRTFVSHCSHHHSRQCCNTTGPQNCDVNSYLGRLTPTVPQSKITYASLYTLNSRQKKRGLRFLRVQVEIVKNDVQNLMQGSQVRMLLLPPHPVGLCGMPPQQNADTCPSLRICHVKKSE